MNKLEAIEANLAIMFGRLNGLHAAVLTLTRQLPAEVASRVATELVRVAEAVHADALATPTPEVALDEMRRVILQLAEVAEHARKNK